MRFREFYEAKLPPTRRALPGEDVAQMWAKYKQEDPNDATINYMIKSGAVPDEASPTSAAPTGQQQLAAGNTQVQQNTQIPQLPQFGQQQTTSLAQFQNAANAAKNNPIGTGVANAQQMQQQVDTRNQQQMQGRGETPVTSDEILAKAKEIGANLRLPNDGGDLTDPKYANILNTLRIVGNSRLTNTPFYRTNDGRIKRK